MQAQHVSALQQQQNRRPAVAAVDSSNRPQVNRASLSHVNILYTYIYIYIHVLLLIIMFSSCQQFVVPSTGPRPRSSAIANLKMPQSVKDFLDKQVVRAQASERQASAKATATQSSVNVAAVPPRRSNRVADKNLTSTSSSVRLVPPHSKHRQTHTKIFL